MNDFEKRKATAIDELRDLVASYERFYKSRVWYDRHNDSFRYCGRAYDYTSSK